MTNPRAGRKVYFVSTTITLAIALVLGVAVRAMAAGGSPAQAVQATAPSRASVAPSALSAAAPAIAPPSASAEPMAPAALQIPRTVRPPQLEDFLSGTPHGEAAVVADFRQRSPGDGVPVSRKTAAYLSYDDKNLYVIFVCDDEPGAVRVRMAKREEIASDDRVAVYLDTFHDGRHAYAFESNPLGLQRDGLMTDGQQTDYTFDAVWNSEGRLTETGYVVWMAIPFKSLRFPHDPEQNWAVALHRSILRTNESAYWPAITLRIVGFVSQMADMHGISGISPPRNMQFIPYTTFTGSHFLDRNVPAFRTQNEGRAGLDAKFVIKDAVTLDATVNPDFSQVESDEPQVTANQRYEVQFPEKRPFFMDNSGYFQTPLNLFYSRRIIDPQFGARLTGKVGSWAVGGLLMDDGAQGETLQQNDPHFGDRAALGIARVQREFGSQSHVGLLATSRDFGPSFNRVFGFDTRLKLSPTWYFSGQMVQSETRTLTDQRMSGPGYSSRIDYGDRNLNYSASYKDLSPDFRSDLGFIKRVNIRETTQYVSYLWRPEGSHLLSFGPSVSGLVNWDHQGRFQEWDFYPQFIFNFARQTSLTFSHYLSQESYGGITFHRYIDNLSLNTQPLRWLGVYASYIQGTGINYSPPAALPPFLGDVRSASFNLIFRPVERFRLDGVYLYDGLKSSRENLPVGVAPSTTIFNNHLTQLKINYQFTRALSLRGIVNYYALLPNTTLVNGQKSKSLTGDVLLTYLLHPGTAFYVGYTNQRQNLTIDSASIPTLQVTTSPSTMTGRQFFIKLSYILRY